VGGEGRLSEEEKKEGRGVGGEGWRSAREREENERRMMWKGGLSSGPSRERKSRRKEDPEDGYPLGYYGLPRPGLRDPYQMRLEIEIPGKGKVWLVGWPVLQAERPIKQRGLHTKKRAY